MFPLLHVKSSSSTHHPKTELGGLEDFFDGLTFREFTVCVYTVKRFLAKKKQPRGCSFSSYLLYNGWVYNRESWNLCTNEAIQTTILLRPTLKGFVAGRQPALLKDTLSRKDGGDSRDAEAKIYRQSPYSNIDTENTQ
ncbi:hypothetical protein OUZ56_020840 [Daphnia magna]|uniref:Uncharacterized protein n=1 Tax=Daphnia magna TaxID=35525 RepID=A0ABQ9ZGP4_9CRUS|nr:hypothetical protein OUZ56_020840 [Daphnia magna]